jgi:hypothetical protein
MTASDKLTFRTGAAESFGLTGAEGGVPQSGETIFPNVLWA